jgi:hypothetical protein
MFAVLVRKELLSNLLTFRLAVALLFTVFLAALTTLIGSLDYSPQSYNSTKTLRDVADTSAAGRVDAPGRDPCASPPWSVISMQFAGASINRCSSSTRWPAR